MELIEGQEIWNELKERKDGKDRRRGKMERIEGEEI
jgi:hypothetical protein